MEAYFAVRTTSRCSGGAGGDRKRKVRLEMTTLGLGSGIGERGVIRRVRSTQKQNLLKAGEEWGVHSYFATTTRKSQEAERGRETPLGIKRLHRSGWLSSLSGMEWAGANKCIFDESSCTRKRGTSYSRWVPPGALMPPIICNRQRKPGRRIIPLTWGPFPEPGILPEQDRLKAEPYPLRLVPVAPSRSLSKYLKAEPESLLVRLWVRVTCAPPPSCLLGRLEIGPEKSRMCLNLHRAKEGGAQENKKKETLKRKPERDPIWMK